MLEAIILMYNILKIIYVCTAFKHTTKDFKFSFMLF